MTMTYAFPDLHGRLDIFLAALAAIRSKPDDTLVFLGDYIDRGTQSAELIAALRKLQETRPNTICLSGNHEYMMVWAFEDAARFLPVWIANGGGTTLASYTNGLGELEEDRMHDDMKWMDSLPLFHADDYRVYVHAGVQRGTPLSHQKPETMHWMRYADGDTESFDGRHVVHGHTPNKLGPIIFEGRSALDVGGYRTGRYVVAVYDNDVPGGPQDIIEVRV